MDESFVAWIEPLAASNHFQAKQRQATAIQGREGQDINDCKIQTQKRRQVEYWEPPKLWDEAGGLASKVNNARWPRYLMDIERAVYQIANQVSKSAKHDTRLLHGQPWDLGDGIVACSDGGVAKDNT